MSTPMNFISNSRSKGSIVDTSKKAARIDHAQIQKAFGARKVGTMAGLDLFAVRDALTQLLASTGGRPAIEGSNERVKIPRIEQDWVMIEKIALRASGLVRKPSAGQTAAVILHLALSRLANDDIETEIKKAFGAPLESS